jgi:hypothetical protein
MRPSKNQVIIWLVMVAISIVMFMHGWVLVPLGPFIYGASLIIRRVRAGKNKNNG